MRREAPNLLSGQSNTDALEGKDAIEPLLSDKLRMLSHY